MNFSHSTSLLKQDHITETHFDQKFELWEKIIIGGNLCYEKGQVLTALGAYSQAIAVAKELINIAPCNRKSLTALITSFHNRSDVYLYYHQSNETQLALSLAYDSIRQAEQAIEEIERRYVNNIDVMRLASIARQQRLLFVKRHPNYSEIYGPHLQQNHEKQRAIH
ncbi:hypothetical protein D210916BOD24_02510 [Alteromonas sp. D210916BOD_24]|uniref:hypothetical protein n=1 Tax=Alteromonas sp. D210916BOD_24 TaxID=3157618 RepID=UPI00399CB2C8